MSSTKWCGKEKTVQSQVLGGAAICLTEKKKESLERYEKTHTESERRHSLMRGSSGR